MRLCIDIQSAVSQRAGVGRYTRLLVQHLGRCAAGDEIGLFFFDFRRRGVPFTAPNCTLRPVRWCPGRLVQRAWKTLRWPPFDWFAGRADLYHFPNFILPPLTRGRSVVTVHDMSFLRYPQFAETRNARYLSACIRDTVSRADAVITDSRFSRSEIQELLAVPADRVFPVHLGISEEFRPPADAAARDNALARLGITPPYLLTVCTLEPRKNIPFLVDVFEQLTDFDGRLVIAGMRGWKYEPILERIRTSTRADCIQFLEYVADDDLPALYAGADLFIFPSHYEGFGLPPLEAMACGTPAVSSSGGSLAEVLGDAAVVLDTFDLDRWTAEIRRVLSDSSRRDRLIEAGRQRTAGYTWDRTAEETWNVYKRVLA